MYQLDMEAAMFLIGLGMFGLVVAALIGVIALLAMLNPKLRSPLMVIIVAACVAAQFLWPQALGAHQRAQERAALEAEAEASLLQEAERQQFDVLENIIWLELANGSYRVGQLIVSAPSASLGLTEIVAERAADGTWRIGCRIVGGEFVAFIEDQELAEIFRRDGGCPPAYVPAS